MFAALSEKLTAAIKDLGGRGVLTEAAVKDGLREIRRILLEADVSYELTRTFTERVRERAVGVVKLKAVSPGQHLVKIVSDAKTDEVLGVQMVGPEVTELIAEATLAIEMGATTEDIALTVHAHPTWPESMMEAAEAVHKQAIHILNT